MDSELSAILARRQRLNDALDKGEKVSMKQRVVKNVFIDFSEFSRIEIQKYQATFKRHTSNDDGVLNLEDLKKLMEELGAPQTHLALRKMFKEVDEDQDGLVSFYEFMLIYRKASGKEVETNPSVSQFSKLSKVNVDAVGVVGAKKFFENKITEIVRTNKFEKEVRREQELRKQMDEEKARKRQQLQDTIEKFKKRG